MSTTFSHSPEPSLAEQQRSAQLSAHIMQEVQQLGGFMPFARFMQQALYHPQFGYYSAQRNPFGKGGDFVTAPLATSLFGATLAAQLRELLHETGGVLYEFGAGDGSLAASILPHLMELEHYYIVEISPTLVALQRENITRRSPEFSHKVQHLSALPVALEGVIIGNEVLDAMPFDVVRFTQGRYVLSGVMVNEKGALESTFSDAVPPEVAAEAKKRIPPIEGYTSELHLRQQAFISTLAKRLNKGAILLIDYGFDEQEYYRTSRKTGTLMGHYRHHAIDSPLFHIGLCDITAHINFTAMADAMLQGGLDLIGYTTQANFLNNLGLTQLLADVGLPASCEYIQEAAACQMLLSPQQMGQRFKVIAGAKNLQMIDWKGFSVGDKCHLL